MALGVDRLALALLGGDDLRQVLPLHLVWSDAPSDAPDERPHDGAADDRAGRPAG